MNQGLVRLDRVEHFVLDEADRMLDMGFVNDVRKVARELPARRQTLLFSATVPRPIEALAQSLLHDPVRVDVTPTVAAAETIEQSVVFVPRDQKSALLERMLQSEGVERAIVFTRTKHGANRLSQRLERAGIGAPAIHGNKSQSARERALAGFRGGKTRILVATDIAARGIDVDGISHVINFDLPNVPESYVHRVGRTGRAGARGRAISLVDRDEQGLLRDIERLLRQRLDVLDAKTFGDVSAPTRREPEQSDVRSAHGEPRSNGEHHQNRDVRPPRRNADFRPHGEPRRNGDFRPHGEPRRSADFRPHGEPRRNGDIRPQSEPRRNGDIRPQGEPRRNGDIRPQGEPHRNGDFRPQSEARRNGDFRPQGEARRNGDFRPQGEARRNGDVRPHSGSNGEFRANGEPRRDAAPEQDGAPFRNRFRFNRWGQKRSRF
jgi:ATP-dependent RNA helicase RhlE